MKDENGWKHFNLHLLARLARIGWAGLCGPELRDVYQCVLNGSYRIGLRKNLKVSYGEIRADERKQRAWM